VYFNKQGSDTDSCRKLLYVEVVGACSTNREFGAVPGRQLHFNRLLATPLPFRLVDTDIFSNLSVVFSNKWLSLYSQIHSEHSRIHRDHCYLASPMKCSGTILRVFSKATLNNQFVPDVFRCLVSSIMQIQSRRTKHVSLALCSSKHPSSSPKWISIKHIVETVFHINSRSL